MELKITKVGIQLPKALASTSLPVNSGVMARATRQKRLGQVSETPSHRIITETNRPTICMDSDDSPPMGGRNWVITYISRAIMLRIVFLFMITSLFT